VADSLKSKTIHALSWSFLESIGLQSVQFVIGIILARLLFPAQFGLIAMLTIFMAVAQSCLDSGFGAALIQKQDATHSDFCSIFYFNILVGMVLAGLLCLAAPWIADFYSQPILTPLTRVLSLIIVIDSFSLVHSTLLIKNIDFKSITKVSLMASVLSGVVGITMAVMGYGVWSLVAQQILSAIVRTICLWLLKIWKPGLIFSLKSLSAMFGYGSKLFASGLLNRIFENSYLIVIGKMFSASDLGLFSRAKNIQEIPSNTLAGLVGRVTFPVFSTIQDDPARLKRGLKSALTVLVMVNFPIMIGLAAIAHPLVVVLLTEKWAACIPYLQLLCVVGMIYPLHLINLNLLQAMGRSDLFLRLEIIKKTLVIINIAVTWRWGISAMIYGMLLLTIMSYYLNSYYTGILIGYPIREQLRDLLSYLVMAALTGIIVYMSGLLPYPNYWSMLLVQIMIGVVIYVSLCRLFRLPAFMEVWQGGWRRMQLLRSDISG
jgi:teichuronic acid exporter